MTRKEWVMEHKPDRVDVSCAGGVHGCPGDYKDMPGDNKPIICKFYRGAIEGKCAECWNTLLPDEAEPPKKDMINPDHYKVHKHECFLEIKALLSPEEYRGWLKGSVLKYRYRTGHKDDPAQENSKSDWFMDKLMEELGMIEPDFVIRMEGM